MIWFFGSLFIAGAVGSAVVITRKIPLVLATPRQVVDDYFQQETTRVHIRVLRIKAWFQKGEYWDPILFLTLRFLRNFRILLLRLERLSFEWIQYVNERYEASKAKNGNGEKEADAETPGGNAPRFWNELKGRTKDEPQ
ncbi:MAG: hypothetical protein HY471_03015 [Candidatus Sungbacteria bacterium]|nr:hypothetical protein [Candidatus Sungbacteria bacterium]